MEVPKNPNETAELQRAREAEQLLDHPMLNAALEAIEGHFQRSWLATGIDEVQERETAFGMLKCAQTFRNLLTEHLTTGKLAAFQKDTRAVQESSTQ